MHIIYDDDSEVALCKIYDFFADLFKAAIWNNGDGELLLKSLAYRHCATCMKKNYCRTLTTGNGKMIIPALMQGECFLNYIHN